MELTVLSLWTVLSTDSYFYHSLCVIFSVLFLSIFISSFQFVQFSFINNRKRLIKIFSAFLFAVIKQKVFTVRMQASITCNFSFLLIEFIHKILLFIVRNISHSMNRKDQHKLNNRCHNRLILPKPSFQYKDFEILLMSRRRNFSHTSCFSSFVHIMRFMFETPLMCL